LANIRLLIVDPDINYRTDFRKTLQRAGIDVVGEADYGADALSLAQVQKPDAVAIAWHNPAARPEQTLEALSVSLAAVPLIVDMDTDNEISAARQAVHAGAHDFLPKPVTAKDFTDALSKAFAAIERRRIGDNGDNTPVNEGVVISLFGAKGGIGKTTLATNLAVALNRFRNESVALLDIDTRFGDVALVLDLHPEKNIGDVVRNIDEVDRFNIRSYLTHHPSGISILAAPTRPSEWRQVHPGHVDRVIKLLGETHDFVVLDTPGFFTDLVGVALDMSDLVLLITTLDVSSIKDCAMAVDMLANADYPMDRVKLIINHPTDLHRVDVKQVKAVTGCEVFWSIPYDRNIVRSGQLGTPTVMAKAASKGAKSMIDLALAISGGKRERRLFGRKSQPPPAPRREVEPLIAVPQAGQHAP
jgi:pilus assembly protein CpaE